MTVTLNENTIQLSGPCGVEEVETLVGYLDRHPDLHIDLSAATTIHTALWQAMMVFQPRITGAPESSLISEKVVDAINAHICENHPT